ncbi:hypothetical protein [Lunatimonas salinarum]|uniref:hypothetical protein n=1 Tax=Lunatimonas salinarum TaxID=1774590 RepID=UPI001AE067D0|nr:hypothetical protein [Lunatimonas salinarum]
MQLFKIIFILIAVSMFSSCVSKYSILNQNYETNKVSLSGNVSGLNIIDKRSNITDEKIKIPVISFPGQFDKVSPILSEEHNQLIKNQIRSYFTNSEEEIKVNCYILIGYQEFSAHTFHEREYVQFDTKIELLNEKDNVIRFCSSTAFFEVKSSDASNDYIDEIYKKAIRTSVYKCFEKLDE